MHAELNLNLNSHFCWFNTLIRIPLMFLVVRTHCTLHECIHRLRKYILHVATNLCYYISEGENHAMDHKQRLLQQITF